MNSLSDSAKRARADTVLVLDDDVLVRMPICQYLRDCGYRVLEAANANEAATILQERAVCRLMMNSNLVDCKTGRSAGLAPLRMLPV